MNWLSGHRRKRGGEADRWPPIAPAYAMWVEDGQRYLAPVRSMDKARELAREHNGVAMSNYPQRFMYEVIHLLDG